MTASSMANFFQSTLARAIATAIRGYQIALSPYYPARCRFFPSCSDYAMEAVELHGPYMGSWLGLRRICRCHPWNPGGLDPVSAAPKLRASSRRVLSDRA
jgi:uncharacterized protein